MSFDSMPLILAYKMTQTAEDMVKKAQDNLERNREILRGEWCKLLEAVKGIFEEELMKFPASMPFRIYKDSYCFTLNAENREICVDATFKDREGNQPDEYFSEEDLQELSRRFGEEINPRLVSEGVPFTFGGFMLPPEYMKKK